MPTHPQWDNLDDFLEPGDFASLATITLASGKVLRNVAGILDEMGVAAQIGTFEQDTTRPTFYCKAFEVTAVKRGDSLLIEGKRYEAHKKPHQDGHGMATITLEPAL